MKAHNVKNFVVSGSNTPFENLWNLQIDKKYHTNSHKNPHGESKYFLENILKDLAASDKVIF